MATVKKYCTETSQCGDCSVLGSHSAAECEADAYCFIAGTFISSRLSAPDIAQSIAWNRIFYSMRSQFMSLGSARRELLYRQKPGTGTMTSSLGTRYPAQSADKMSSSTVPARPFEADSKAAGETGSATPGKG